MTTEKMALCIPVQQINIPINQWSPMLVSRDVCETNESFLQIIPYVIIRDITTNKIFQYTRGKAGQEARLHAKTSIGIGGHIEEIGTDLFDTVAKECSREIEEETGAVVEPHIIGKILKRKEYYVIHTKHSKNQVDRVHVALAFVLPLDKAKMTKLEQGVILEPKWRTANDLVADAKDPDTDLENWSCTYLKFISSIL